MYVVYLYMCIYVCIFVCMYTHRLANVCSVCSADDDIYICMCVCIYVYTQAC